MNVDWTVLDLPHIDEVAQGAARAVSNKYRDKKVMFLAEFEDLYQEARIILATKLSNRAKAINPNLLWHELYKDLLNIVRTPLRKFRGNVPSDVSLWTGQGELSLQQRAARGTVEFPTDGTGSGPVPSPGILRMVPIR